MAFLQPVRRSTPGGMSCGPAMVAMWVRPPWISSRVAPLGRGLVVDVHVVASALGQRACRANTMGMWSLTCAQEWSPVWCGDHQGAGDVAAEQEAPGLFRLGLRCDDHVQGVIGVCEIQGHALDHGGEERIREDLGRGLRHDQA